MFGVNFLKAFCVVASVGLAASIKFDATKLDTASLVKPILKELATPFWDNDFCRDFDDLTAFPHPDSCQEYLICYDNQIFEGQCPPGQLFDAWNGFCDRAENVKCLNHGQDSRCPPRGSNEVRFLRGPQCNQFYLCFDGEPHLFTCHQGSHWNANLNFCDEPRFAGCAVSFLNIEIF